MIDFRELPPDGIKFEQLIRELLIKSEFEVHWTGVGPDGGRDLIFIEKSEGRLAPFQRKWLVSCKHNAHLGRSVGIDDIVDFSGACEAVGAEGFLLVCSTQPTSSVVRRFEELERWGRILARYWDVIEIEKRLNTPSTLGLIYLFFPESSKNIGWNIYNTNSPSFWAANYKDYFMYLSCRLTNAFPNLKDVEEIIRRIEEIPLPEGDNWNRHYLRPRAIYYDNKNEQFVVFVDYLYPTGELKNVLGPDQLNKYLRDGQGLYFDEESMWHLTYWDVEYIDCNQTSDSFDIDHKQYYEPFINNYKIGLSRNEFISERKLFRNELVFRNGKLIEL
jgi:hypothetical protein